MRRIIKYLLDERAFQSVILFCDVWIASLKVEAALNDGQWLQHEFLIAYDMMGDALFGLGEFKRASFYYERSPQLWRSQQASLAASKTGSKIGARLQVKMAECQASFVDHSAVNTPPADPKNRPQQPLQLHPPHHRQALAYLSAVDLRSLSPHSLLLRARLLENAQRAQDACQVYAHILMHHPFVIEAALSLIRLSANPTAVGQQQPPGGVMDPVRVVSTVTSAVQRHQQAYADDAMAAAYELEQDDGEDDAMLRGMLAARRQCLQSRQHLIHGSSSFSPSSSSSSRSNLLHDPASLQWVIQLAQAHAHMTRYAHRQALDCLSDLNQALPNILHVLQLCAQSQLQLSDSDSARLTFEQIRILDPFIMDGMDLYAFSLHSRCAADSMHELVQSLQQIDAGRSEFLLAAALHAALLGQRDQAFFYCERAVQAAPTRAASHSLSAFVFASMDQHDGALTAYRNAYALDKRDLGIFQGLVDANLALGKFKEALLMSKEALQRAPRNPKALTMVGTVLSHTPEGREKGRAAFTKALEIDPFCIDAIFAMVKLDTTEKKFEEAAALLSKQLVQHNRDVIHTKLATIYTFMGDNSRAVQHFQAALSLNPNYEPAVTGLEQLEAEFKDAEPEVDLSQYQDGDEEDVEYVDEEEADDDAMYASPS